VEFFEPRFEIWVILKRCFEDGEHLLAGFDGSFPTVDGFDGWYQIDTSCVLRMDEDGANLARLLQAGEGAKD
jgi:hypothetical protein